MRDVYAYWAVVDEQVAAAVAAPLSLRKAFAAIVLLDQTADAVFDRWRSEPDQVLGAEDLPAFREIIAEKSPELALIAGIASQGDARLVREWVAYDPAEVTRLGVGEFMISLYNDHSVERLLIRSGEGEPVDALAIITGARDWWDYFIRAL